MGEEHGGGGGGGSKTSDRWMIHLLHVIHSDERLGLLLLSSAHKQLLFIVTIDSVDPPLDIRASQPQRMSECKRPGAHQFSSRKYDFYIMAGH